MKKYRNRFLLLAAYLFVIITASAQQQYRYSVDLTKAADDQLQIELLAPAISKSTIRFYLPKIVPGTYMNSNFGKYVHDLKAFDKAGKTLPVKKIDDNGWEIKNATQLKRIVYKVEDTWDASIDNDVYSMVGTNFEAGKNFVINTCGLFGYFENMKNLPYELNFTKPDNFYGATGLKPVSTSSTKDIFRCVNTDELYDSPIMFSPADTATVMVGNTEVLVAVYSPNKIVHAKFMADHMQQLLAGTKDYLAGKLPVSKYAFIYYFNSNQKIKGASGAWEHSYSSFYCIGEEPQEEAIDHWVDISAHEFFHIVSPLTISSREVKEFNFNETHLSKHLWLYEGSTEYYAVHMQVWTGQRSPDWFLKALAAKIRYSRDNFKDSLSFTELSTESADKWKDQFVNVYFKGALINACLDLYLLQLSNGQYSFRNLKHDLGVKFGKDKYFLDDSLFDEIEKLSFPEIKQFLLTYVQGSTPIPYEKYFALAGVDYIPRETIRAFSMGGIDMDADSTGKITIGTADMNEFGKKMQYKEGDQLLSLNGVEITNANLTKQLQQFTSTAKEGDLVTVTVKRKNATGMETVTLQAPAMKVDKPVFHSLKFTENPTPQQLKIRRAWLNTQN